MTEEHEKFPWRAEMYFTPTEFPQFEGLADVFAGRGPRWRTWLTLCFSQTSPVVDVSWRLHLLGKLLEDLRATLIAYFV